jgi:hypothetical protein
MRCEMLTIPTNLKDKHIWQKCLSELDLLSKNSSAKNVSINAALSNSNQ